MGSTAGDAGSSAVACVAIAVGGSESMIGTLARATISVAVTSGCGGAIRCGTRTTGSDLADGANAGPANAGPANAASSTVDRTACPAAWSWAGGRSLATVRYWDMRMPTAMTKHMPASRPILFSRVMRGFR